MLFSAVEPMSMARFEREIATLVAQVQASTPVTCPADGRYPVDAALNAYLEQSGGLRKGALHQGSGRFIIELAGRSIDIDGSTLYYDSATRKWNRFHNDNRERAEAFQTLVKPLAPCRVYPVLAPIPGKAPGVRQPFPEVGAKALGVGQELPSPPARGLGLRARCDMRTRTSAMPSIRA